MNTKQTCKQRNMIFLAIRCIFRAGKGILGDTFTENNIGKQQVRIAIIKNGNKGWFEAKKRKPSFDLKNQGGKYVLSQAHPNGSQSWIFVQKKNYRIRTRSSVLIIKMVSFFRIC